MKSLYLISVLWIAACATTPSTDTAQTDANVPESGWGWESTQINWSEAEIEAPRYLAWLEGGVESGYKIDSPRVRKKIEAYEANPPAVTDKEAYLEYVSLLDAQGKLPVAGQKIRQFIGAHPQDGRGAFLLGIHYMRLRKPVMAQYLFEKLEKDPKYPWRSLVYNNLGMISLERGDRYAAVDYFEKATKAKPPLAAPLVNLGALYLQSRSYADAEKVFSQAAALDRGLEDAIVGKGAALEGMGKFQEAHLAYAEYLEKNPEAMAVMYNDSIILGKRLGRKDVAVTLMTRYIEKGGKETARAQELVQSWR